MTSAPKYMLSNESITIIWEGKTYTIQKNSPHYQHLADAIHKKDWDAIPNHLTVQKSLTAWARGKFTIDSEAISYDGEVLPDDISERIRAIHAEGKDPGPLFKFWERLLKNPSWRSVKQLFTFLKHEKIPITTDGCFLAYKAVTGEYMDKHTGTVSNKPGTVNKMPRRMISDDPKEACHEGFHVGALGYVNTFKDHAGDRIIVCKVDPEHVVCVPYDHSQEKMRVCEYLVMGNMGEALSSTIHEETVDLESGSVGENADYPGYDPEMDDEDDDDDDEVEGPSEHEEIPKEEKKSKKTEKKSTSTVLKTGKFDPALKKEFSKYNKMGTKELIGLSMDDLRKYATYGVQLVGASKVQGGKTALVALIIKTRK